MKLPDPGQVPKLKCDAAEQQALDAMARLVVSAVDGESTIAQIGEACGMGDDMACRIIGDLAQRGFLVLPGFGDEPEAKSESSAGSSSRTLPGEVDQVYQSLESVNFYDLLHVEPDADRKQLRNSYFALSKKFHPDRAFGADRDDLRRKMEIVFRRMTQAYDVLSNAKQRREYDSYIADQLEIWKIEKQLKGAMELEQGLEQPATVQNQPRQSAIAGNSMQKPSASSDRTATSPSKITVTAPPVTTPRDSPVARSSMPARDPKHDARRRQWRRERAGRALRQTLSGSGSGDSYRPPPSTKSIEQAKIAVEQKQYTEAVRLLEEVLRIDSRNERARELLVQARLGATKVLAQGYIRQGMYERRNGDGERARRNFEKALKIDATSIDARYQLADLLLERRVELSLALRLCREVIGMGGQRARYFATLGELLILAKQAGKASEAFSKALDLEPDNKEYKKRLKACKV